MHIDDVVNNGKKRSPSQKLVVSPPLYYLYVCFLDVGLSFLSNTHRLEVSRGDLESCC